MAFFILSFGFDPKVQKEKLFLSESPGLSEPVADPVVSDPEGGSPAGLAPLAEP